MCARRALWALVLAVGLSVPVGADPLYVYDGGLGTWSDVNKTSVSGAPDSLLCWAAAASNTLAWTGWYGAGGLDTASEIYAAFDAGWSNRTGAPTYAYEWWMTDRTQSIIPGYVFDSAGQNYYPGVSVQDSDASVTAFTSDIWWGLTNYVDDDRGIVMSITVPSGPGVSGTYSHALSVWGYDPIAMQVYVTDSDDGSTGLVTYGFYSSGGSYYLDNYTNRYTSATDAEITQLTRLNRNDTGILPNGGVSTVPEPASLLLVGTGLACLLATRRRRR